MSWARSAQGGLNAARSEASKTVIRLSQLPKTALPSDVRRMLRTNQTENIARVSLIYDRFKPTGRASVTLTTPDSMNNNLRLLQKASISSFPVNASAGEDEEVLIVQRRNRGVKGRKEASNRGIVDGNGPDGGIVSNGKCVTVWGLPGKLEAIDFEQYLKRFKHSIGQEEITKLQPPIGSLSSRHLVRCASVSEAHRLVRMLHMTYFNSKSLGNKYLIGARVIY